MRVAITFDFSDEERAALAEYCGHAQPFRHHDLRTWMLSTLRAGLDVIVSEYDELTKGDDAHA